MSEHRVSGSAGLLSVATYVTHVGSGHCGRTHREDQPGEQGCPFAMYCELGAVSMHGSSSM
ncbi:hypothetical protein GCM10009578_008980 [Streptomyces rhizosphaericus]